MIKTKGSLPGEKVEESILKWLREFGLKLDEVLTVLQKKLL